MPPAATQGGSAGSLRRETPALLHERRRPGPATVALPPDRGGGDVFHIKALACPASMVGPEARGRWAAAFAGPARNAGSAEVTGLPVRLCARQGCRAAEGYRLAGEVVSPARMPGGKRLPACRQARRPGKKAGRQRVTGLPAGQKARQESRAAEGYRLAGGIVCPARMPGGRGLPACRWDCETVRGAGGGEGTGRRGRMEDRGLEQNSPGRYRVAGVNSPHSTH
jgi:hypothetical protein